MTYLCKTAVCFATHHAHVCLFIIKILICLWYISYRSNLLLYNIVFINTTSIGV